MEKEQFVKEIRGKKIIDIVFPETTTEKPSTPITIVSEDGYHYDVENLKISHPQYEQELNLFLGKLEKASVNSYFDINVNFLSIDEMRKKALEHAKKINANGGNVSGNYSGGYRVRFGEDLKTL